MEGVKERFFGEFLGELPGDFLGELLQVFIESIEGLLIEFCKRFILLLMHLTKL